MNSEFNERDGRFSPDMRWIAYVSDESGNDEIWIREVSLTSQEKLMETTGRWRISKGGGMEPRWRKDGKELYYRAPEGKIMAVKVNAGTGFTYETPSELFQVTPDYSALAANINLSTWDVTRDGQRFLIPTPVSKFSPSPFNVILNWRQLLKQ